MRYILLLVAASFFLGSCTVNKDILFKTPTDYSYDELPDSLDPESYIAANNMLTFNFFTGNGHVLVEQGIGGGVLSGQNNANRNFMMVQNQMAYLVDDDGTVKLPVLGRVKLEGLSIRQAEQKLEEMYTRYYNEPFIILRVQNNRVIVSPGGGGTAQVITLVNNNTTLMEALAMVGGIDARGNASKVKLIRQDPETKKRSVYSIDLSTIEGIEEADLVVQANDIIYVEPLPLIAREVVQELAPIVTLITTTALLITVLNIQ